MGAKSSASKGKALKPIPWTDPIEDGLTVIELSDEEAIAQWLAAFNMLHTEDRLFAPTAPMPLEKS